MKIAYMMGNTVHWVTPYTSLAAVPEHPPNDIYIEIPDNVQEGWLYDSASGQYAPPPPPSAPEMSFAQAIALIFAKSLGLELDAETELKIMKALMSTAGEFIPPAPMESDWKPGEYVTEGMIRIYSGVTYYCIVPHITQAGQSPNMVPEYWAKQWTVGEIVGIGTVRVYNGILYECLQHNHKCKVGQEPPIAPSVWKVYGSTTSDNGAPQQTTSIGPSTS